MVLRIEQRHLYLARYVTARLLVEDAVWASLSSLEEDSDVEAIKRSFADTYSVSIDGARVRWLLMNRTERFRRVGDDVWGLTAWHVRKNAPFHEKAEAFLRLSAMPLPSEELADLFSRSSVDSSAAPETVDGLLRGRPGMFEKLGRYWLLGDWTCQQSCGRMSPLAMMIVRNSEGAVTGRVELRGILRSIFGPLNAAVDTENLRWALRCYDGTVSTDVFFGSGFLEPVFGGHWILYDLVPELMGYFSGLQAAEVDELEEHLGQILSRVRDARVETGAKTSAGRPDEDHRPGDSEAESTGGGMQIPAGAWQETDNIHGFTDGGLTPDEQQGSIIYAPGSRRQLVLAPPGSGKTEVVARRLAHLVSTPDGLKPRQILVLSFSRSAVKVLMDRIRGIVGENDGVYEDLRHVSVRTFDSWTFRMLRLLGVSPRELLQDSPGQDSYTKNITRMLQCMRTGEKRTALLTHEDKLKNIRHMIVDECQDLSGVRADLVRELLTLLAPPAGSSRECACGFTILGDMNQAIYDWMMKDNDDSITSAELVDFVRSNYKRELQEITLCRNYRSTDEIIHLVDRAEAVIRDESPDAGLRTTRMIQLAAETGGEYSIADLGVYCQKPELSSSMGVLFRRNYEAVYTASRLQNQYELSGHGRLSVDAGGAEEDCLPAWIGYLLGRYRGADITQSHFLKLYAKYGQCSKAATYLPEPMSAWGLLMRACYGEAGADNDSVRMDDLRERLTWQDALPDDEGVQDKRIVITTVHRSKGQQFGDVVLVDSHFEDYPDQDLDEAKVVYVGLSRAQESIMVLANPESKEFYPRSFRNSSKGTEYERFYRYDPEDEWLRLLEIGIPGDVDLTSFVNRSFHGTEADVERVQEFLFHEHENLAGRGVVLRKRQISEDPPRVVYDIAVATAEGVVMNLGCTTSQLTLDLYRLRPKGARFPDEIQDLRISQVMTVIGCRESLSCIDDPWMTSGMWLGLRIHGIGRFRFTFGR